MSLLVAALTELSHYYELPMWGTAGCTDAKYVGLQAGLEVMQQCMMTALSGANFVHDVGLIANGMQVSPELITLDRTQVNQEAGADDTASSEEMLRQKTIDIMDNHEPPPIANDVMTEVRSLEKSWFEKLDLKYEYQE